MLVRAVLSILCITAFSVAAYGQPMVVNFINMVPLTDSCTAGTPLPNGTPILIFHDPTFNGPSEDDYQPIVGTEPGNVNYNSFVINGPEHGFPPGTFISDPAEYWVSVALVPTPPLFYLLVCGPENHYYSNTFVVGPNYNEFWWAPEAPNSWTCVEEPCDICLPPSRPQNAVASTDLCDGVNLSWEHDGDDICGFLIHRDGAVIDSVAETIFEYMDDDAPSGSSEFEIQAVRCCPDEIFQYSPRSSPPSVGTRLPGPPIPTINEAIGDCNQISIEFVVSTIQGLDSFHVYCGGVWVGSTGPGTAGSPQVFIHANPDPGPQDCWVVGWSAACGEGTTSDTVTVEALFVPGPVENFSTTTDDCEAICLTWTYTGDDADEFVIVRNNNDFAAVLWVEGQTDYTFCDSSGVPGQAYGFRVRACNECGCGPDSDNTLGERRPAPGQVANVEASDGANCACIIVTWDDFPEDLGVTHYTIFRDFGQLATVDPAEEFYEDCDPTLVPGQEYTYIVAATNPCGEGSINGDDVGSVRLPNDGSATLSLVTHSGPDWDYELTWDEGCVSRLTIRDLCTGTEGSLTEANGWTVTNHLPDSVVFTTDDPLIIGSVTGFRLSNDDPNCEGNGRWRAGDGTGSVEGPLPVEATREIPTEYALNIYPNPFNPSTNIAYDLPKAGEVQIHIYDVTGRLTRELVGGFHEAGYHRATFSASGLPTGLYFARIVSGNFITTKKLMMLK